MRAHRYREPVNKFLLLMHARAEYNFILFSKLLAGCRSHKTDFSLGLLPNTTESYDNYPLWCIEQQLDEHKKYITKGITLYLPGKYEDGPNRMYDSLAPLLESQRDLIGVERDYGTYIQMKAMHTGKGSIVHADVWDEAAKKQSILTHLWVCGTSNIDAYIRKLQIFVSNTDCSRLRSISITASRRRPYYINNTYEHDRIIRILQSKFHIVGLTAVVYGAPRFGQGPMETITFTLVHKDEVETAPPCILTKSWFGYSNPDKFLNPYFGYTSTHVRDTSELKVDGQLLKKAGIKYAIQRVVDHNNLIHKHLCNGVFSMAV